MPNGFIADDDIRDIAKAYAADAVDDALRNMAVTLDWSEDSIASVEQILDTLHKSVRMRRPPAEAAETIVKVFGSYIGEVFIRHHGGTWGVIQYGGQIFPGIQATGDGNLFWPWLRTLKRLREGAEENVVHYYLHLTHRLQSTRFPSPTRTR